MAKQPAFLPALKLSFSTGREFNEDQAVCLKHAGVRLAAAFDGCGGVGGRRYPHLNHHTGAYIAAGLYAGCLKEWFLDRTRPISGTAGELGALFQQAAQEYAGRFLSGTPSAVTGSMVRTLPSTAAIALLDGKDVTVYWAGNTRVYLLTGEGLRQLTQDDLAARRDAFDSLFLDAPITNYLCADKPFTLHETTVALPEKGLLVLATDGAFHALPTPMHLEALLLDTLEQASSKKRWKTLLTKKLSSCAADDVTLIVQPFGFQVFDGLKPYFDKRRRHVKQAYILPAERAERESMTVLRSLWEMYQKE